MNKIDFTQPGGFPFDQSILGFLQDSITLVQQLANLCGPFAILSGCVVAGGSVSAGVIVINGEILPFAGGVIQAKVIINEVDNSFVYQDNTPRAVQAMRTASFGDDGVTNILWASFVRTSAAGLISDVNNMFLTGDIKEIDCTMAYMAANFDATGLGINQRLGWAICNGQNGTKDRRGLTSVQLDITQPEFATLGQVYGEKEHELIEEELPEITPEIPGSENGTGNGSRQKAAWSDNEAVDQGSIEGTPFGSGEAHNNIQPSITTLIIQKL